MTFGPGMNRVLREQPLAVVMAGLAAGAAVAAVFPTTEMEERTLGPAGESVRQAAGKAAERVKDAAGKAGERLKSAAEERGLTTESLKELAGEVSDTFTNAVATSRCAPSWAASFALSTTSSRAPRLRRAPRSPIWD
jgi:hypothetical protein